MNTLSKRNSQQGAALVVGLVLLVVISVLAVSSINTATTELAMARNDTNYENAFQAAETGLENALAVGQFSTVIDTNLAQNITANEAIFNGHFPGEPIFPGVLILEAMAPSCLIGKGESTR